MAAGQERALRQRIKSVEATKKITRAMELIAASQISKAQGRIATSRPYQNAIARALAETSMEIGYGGNSLLGEVENPTKVLILAIVSDRGLCGGYNNSVLRATERAYKSYIERGIEVVLTTVGKKAQNYFRFRSIPVLNSYISMTDKPQFSDAIEIGSTFMEPIMATGLDEPGIKAEIISTRFISPGTQKVEVFQLFPILQDMSDVEAVEKVAKALPEIEPEAPILLKQLLPQYIETAIFAALLEASASEHTARQRAMSAATENAEELITTYVREMNRVRQEAITTEIMEIVGGAEALKNSK
jgi:F-type H+-transporting ATPase subunit gamma